MIGYFTDVPPAATAFGWAVFLLVIISGWMVFAKAEKPGWWALIPLVNTFVTIKISGRSGWWILLLLIPVVNIVVVVLFCRGLARAFGHGVGFTIGIWFLPWIFVPILAFGSSTYHGSYGGVQTPPLGY